MKQTHHIHVCSIIFLIHYFDVIILLKLDKIVPGTLQCEAIEKTQGIATT